MASSEIEKELMEDSLKHIDELFRSQLGSAGVTPPAGVFEQCVQQLQSSGTEGQGLNQGASQQSVQSGLGNAMGSVGKTFFGLSAKASLAILGSVVAAVLMVSALVQNTASNKITEVVPVDLSEKAQSEKAKGDENAINADNYNGSISATSPKSVEGALQGNPNSGKSKLANSASSSDNVGTSLQSSNTASAGKNTLGAKSGGGMENLSNVPREKSSSEMSVKVPTDNSNQFSRPTKVATGNINPCQKYSNHWKPVIADIVGGIVSLGIEGKYEKMRVDWADGERSEILTDQLGVERVSHQYWVGHTRTFVIKMLNERRVLDERGYSMICRDSQRVSVSISPAGDVTDIFVPDVFTPNGDGFNEEFYIGMAQPQMFDMCVFDLNNRLIFRSDNYDARWKGICGASVCPEGVYRVVVSYKYSGDKSLKYARKSVKLIYKATPQF
ncbi:MAG: gliding motility-associated C-terminal domain-containing protein [Bacteroidetes bacterium]|nr:gliding motility-associated C-terminal domain-containing protein [Bacteroidota bacterium]MDA1223958.1 gliding motility-associated C-terminal domain-containing protein [Bacteroidota bacterium]